MDISKLDLTPIVGKAILETISQEQRDLLVQQAVEHLIDPQKRKERFGSDTQTDSRLVEVFKEQVELIARGLVREYLQEETNKERLMEVVRNAFEKIVDSEAVHERLENFFIKAVENVLWPEKYTCWLKSKAPRSKIVDRRDS